MTELDDTSVVIIPPVRDFCMDQPQKEPRGQAWRCNEAMRTRHGARAQGSNRMMPHAVQRAASGHRSHVIGTRGGDVSYCASPTN